MTLGHENAGWVEEVGPGVQGWNSGDPVAVYGILGCGRWFACLRGRDNECRTVPVGGRKSTEGCLGLHPEWISDGEAPVDDLPVLQIFRIKDSALSFEGRRGNQRIVDVKAVLRGDPQARFMSINGERHG